MQAHVERLRKYIKVIYEIFSLLAIKRITQILSNYLN